MFDARGPDGSVPPLLSADTTDLTACCVSFYEHPLIKRVFGDSFHPGGADLSLALAERGGVDGDSHLLDVACGPGSTSLLLVAQLGCRVTGVDLGTTSLEQARAAADALGVSGRVTFVRGDAQALPFQDGSFSHVICECALCTFSAQAAAAKEMHRVLAPGGRLMLADVTLAEGHVLPAELDDTLFAVACVTGARSASGYGALLAGAGFTSVQMHDERTAITSMTDRLRKAMVGLKLMVRAGRLSLAELGLAITLEELDALVKLGRREVEAGHVGYATFTANA